MEIEFGFDLSDIIEEIKAKIKKTPIRAERVGSHSVKLTFSENLTSSDVESVKTAITKFVPHLKCRKVVREVKSE